MTDLSSTRGVGRKAFCAPRLSRHGYDRAEVRAAPGQADLVRRLRHRAVDRVRRLVRMARCAEGPSVKMEFHR